MIEDPTQMRERLVRMIHWAIRDRFQKEFGYDCEAFVDEKLTAVIFRVRGDDADIFGSIPVTLDVLYKHYRVEANVGRPMKVKERID